MHIYIYIYIYIYSCRIGCFTRKCCPYLSRTICIRTGWPPPLASPFATNENLALFAAIVRDNPSLVLLAQERKI